MIDYRKFMSRKFGLAMLSLIGAHWALYERLVMSGDFVTLMIGIVGVYVASNVVESISK